MENDSSDLHFLMWQQPFEAWAENLINFINI